MVFTYVGALPLLVNEAKEVKKLPIADALEWGASMIDNRRTVRTYFELQDDGKTLYACAMGAIGLGAYAYLHDGAMVNPIEQNLLRMIDGQRFAINMAWEACGVNVRYPYPITRGSGWRSIIREIECMNDLRRLSFADIANILRQDRIGGDHHGILARA